MEWDNLEFGATIAYSVPSDMLLQELKELIEKYDSRSSYTLVSYQDCMHCVNLITRQRTGMIIQPTITF